MSRLSDEDYDLDSLGFDDKELDFLTDDPLDTLNADAFDDGGLGSEETGPATVRDAIKLDKVFGFSHISPENVPTVKSFIAFIEFKTQKVGEEALVAWAVEHIGG